MANNGYKISVYLDDNPNSATYMETYEERTEDTVKCPISEDDLVLISNECEISITGYTGYRVLIYYNRTTKEYLEVREEDPECIESSTDEIWVDSGSPYCETTEQGVNTGYMLQRQVQTNPNVSTYGEIRYQRWKSPLCEDNSCPIWDEVSRQCHIEVFNCNATFDGTADVVQIDINPLSSTYNQTRQVNIESTATCENCSSTTFKWVEIGEVCGDDDILCDNGIIDERYTIKFSANYSNGTSYSAVCDTTTLTTADTKPTGYTVSSMISANVGNCVTNIGESAFYNCYNLTSVTIPESVVTIDYNAFRGCSSLSDITFTNSLTNIGNGAFSYCYGLTDITIPRSVNNIGSASFAGCQNLTGITVDSNNTTYDSRNNCNGIIQTRYNRLVVGCKNTVIPNTVTEIGTSAFEECNGLQSITIPNSVTSIYSYVFYYCYNLGTITIPDSVITLGSGVFSYCYNLRSVTMPNTITNISSSLFINCNALTRLNSDTDGVFNLPTSLTSIGSYAFQYCYGLTTVSIPNGVTNINNYAFRGCSGLTSVDIPSNVASIGGGAFSGCISLTSITVNADVPPTLGTNAFENTNEAVIYVPAASVETYKAANGWSTYSSRIEAIIQQNE